MAVLRSDQAQLTFAAESAQGADREMMEGTLAASPAGILSGAHVAGSRTLTLTAEFTRWTTAGGAGAQAFTAVSGTTGSETSIEVDDNGNGDPGIIVGRIIQHGSETMKVTIVSGTNNRDFTVIRAYEGSAQAAISDNVAINGRFMPGDVIRIGTLDASDAADTTVAHEIRRVEATDGATIILDRPISFAHASSQLVRCVSAVGGNVTRNDQDKYITFIPGVYDTIDTPDPEMSFEGRRFLSTASKRNWSVAYPGQQTLTGSVSSFILLNGWPLRFPIGSVVTKPERLAGTANTLAAAANKGDVFVTFANSTSLAAGDFICIDDGSVTKSEVRKLLDKVSGNIWKLNYPLNFAHDNAASVEEVHGTNAYYEHTIKENVELDTVSWHVHMLPSDEDYDRKFDRRYVGGMVGSATISADEGGMLSMSWDGVNFLNMLHNQQSQKTVGTNLYEGASVTANMPRYGLMQQIDTDDIGPSGYGAAGAVGLNNGTGYPNTQPYYFSQGTIKFYGQEFARIRNFNLSISNGEEPRYYLGRQGNRARGPYEIKEGPREYSMSATVALPDVAEDASTAHGSSTQDNALELFKQLLLEGDYGGSTAATARAGFTASLRFDRGTNDYIIINIPAGTGTPDAGTNSLNSQGIFINTAQHAVTGDNPFQVDVSMLFRAMQITIRDSEPVYP